MRKRYILLILFLLFNQLLFGQVNNVTFRQISPPGGFTLKSVHIIRQDKLGYMWMATNQGLIRYDSKNTVWFIPEIDNPHSICSEEINDIMIDDDNLVWIATNNGMCTYNRKDQSFTTHNYTYEDGSPGNNKIAKILVNNENRPIILDEKWIGVFHKEKNQVIRIAIHTINSPTQIHFDYKNNLWIGTNNGDVYKYSKKDNLSTKIITGNDYRVNALYIDDNHIHVGFENEGVKIYDQQGLLIRKHAFSKPNGSKHFKGSIRAIKRDTYGRIWYAAYEGLFLNDGNQIIQFKPDENPGLPHNSIFDVFEDSQGGLWIGTWSGGVSLIHHADNHFNTFRHSKIINSISDNKVSSFVQVNENEMLIGTEVGGLNSFDFDTRLFSSVKITDADSIENIKSLCKDKHGGIWIGTYRKGLWYKPQSSSNYKQFKKGALDGMHLTAESVYSLCPVDSGVWIASYPIGLDFYNFRTKKISYTHHFTDDNQQEWNKSIHCIGTDSRSNIWLGTLRGAYKVNYKTNHVEKITGKKTGTNAQNKTIYVIKEHSSGEIWFGSKNNGILIYNPDQNTIRNYNAGGILEGKDVYGIIERENKKIWITSNNGLIHLDPQTESYKHFVYSDGIQSNLFSPQAIYEDHLGNYFLGGASGFTVINPANIKNNTRMPFTMIKEVFVNDSTVIYPHYKGHDEFESIMLGAKENTFSINFFADNYLLPEKNQYQYRLINYYDEWVNIGNEGHMLFTDMKSGEYTFEVKACNNDGTWNEVPSRISIVIKANWYQTVYAYSFYLIVFFIIVFIISLFYIERIRLRQNYLLEKNQRENEEQINEMKLKFFTNISHEFRTPLTLISWPLKKLIKANNITQEQREELEVVQRNTSRLLQLIEQILDFRKQEKAKLHISKFDLISFVHDIQKGFTLESKTKQVEFTLESDLETYAMEADKEKLDMVIFNLLSNAYKYTSKKGQITISIKAKKRSTFEGYNSQLSFGKMDSDDFVEISIEDTGTGIKSEELLKVFNRFEQGSKSGKKGAKNKGSGIGLSICKDYTLLHNGEIIAQSSEDIGSRFTLRIPRKQISQQIMFESHQYVKNLKVNETAKVPLRMDKQADEMVRLLLVEDNIQFRMFISTFLNRYYQVDVATNGEQALDKMKTDSFDMVVSDVMMPKMDGYELCKNIKTNLETSHIPVILLTALSSSENYMTGLDIGADAYLTKPFDQEILLRQIQNILQQRKRIRQNFNKQFVSEKVVEVGPLDNFFLNQVRKIIEKNISNEQFNMEQLADQLSISRSQLHRKIKSLSGHTTTEFVNLVRIKKAVELIERENYSFSEVSFHVGFSSQSYFTKCFKKVYQKTPKEYFAVQKVSGEYNNHS